MCRGGDSSLGKVGDDVIKEILDFLASEQVQLLEKIDSDNKAGNKNNIKRSFKGRAALLVSNHITGYWDQFIDYNNLSEDRWDQPNQLAAFSSQSQSFPESSLSSADNSQIQS